MRFTVDDIMRENPCSIYTEEMVRELWAGRETLSSTDIAGLDICVEDRLWALSVLLWRLSPWRSLRLARRIALDLIGQDDCPDVLWWFLVSGDETSRDVAKDSTFGVARTVWSAAVWSAAVWFAAIWETPAAAREKYLGWLVEAIGG